MIPGYNRNLPRRLPDDADKFCQHIGEIDGNLCNDRATFEVIAWGNVPHGVRSCAIFLCQRHVGRYDFEPGEYEKLFAQGQPPAED